MCIFIFPLIKEFWLGISLYYWGREVGKRSVNQQSDQCENLHNLYYIGDDYSFLQAHLCEGDGRQDFFPVLGVFCECLFTNGEFTIVD